jgi:hypothetical protein
MVYGLASWQKPLRASSLISIYKPARISTVYGTMEFCFEMQTQEPGARNLARCAFVASFPPARVVVIPENNLVTTSYVLGLLSHRVCCNNVKRSCNMLAHDLAQTVMRSAIFSMGTCPTRYIARVIVQKCYRLFFRNYIPVRVPAVANWRDGTGKLPVYF